MELGHINNIERYVGRIGVPF